MVAQAIVAVRVVSQKRPVMETGLMTVADPSLPHTGCPHQEAASGARQVDVDQYLETTGAANGVPQLNK